MKKGYKLHGTELSYVTLYVDSDKSPEEFDSLMEFFRYADFIDLKGHDGEITHIEDWEEIDD